MNRMTLKDYAAMSACYAMVGLLFVMVLNPAGTAAFITGLLP